MAGAGYTVDLSALHKGSTDAADAKGEVHTILDNLLNALIPLESDWQDEASASFHELIERYKDAQDGLEEALEGISETLETTAQNYEESEQVNSEGMVDMAGAFPV